MVKEEEIIAEEAGGRGFMYMLGLGEEPDYLPCLSPSSDLSFASVCATADAGGVTLAAASPTCASYLAPPPHHRILNFSGQEHHRGGGMFGFQCYGGDQAIPAVVPQKSSPTAECSSSISSMSSSPPATAVQAASGAKPHAFKKKGSRAGAQRKTASPAATTTNKRPRVRREKLGERIIALQQLVSPFGKSDTASVLHEALGYIRFLHDQVQVLSSPYMQRLPLSARAPESAAAGDLRNRGLCLVPVSCTEHVAGDGGGSCNGADMWSVVAGVAAVAEEIADEKAKKKRE